MYYEIQSFTYTIGIWLVAFIMAWYMNAYTEKEKQTILAQKKQAETELNLLLNDSAAYAAMSEASNPYGDGTASKQIADALSSL